MFKFLLIWILANYSYENISDTYKTYKTENPIREMREFIDKQQFREDQLRDHCNLQNFKMKEKLGYYDIIIDTIKRQFITSVNNDLILSLSYPKLIYTKQMEANSYDELMNMSYSSENEDNDIIYDNQTYTLIRSGIKTDAPIYSYSNQINYDIPRKPIWTIQLGEHILTITDIK